MILPDRSGAVHPNTGSRAAADAGSLACRRTFRHTPLRFKPERHIFVSCTGSFCKLKQPLARWLCSCRLLVVWFAVSRPV